MLYSMLWTFGVKITVYQSRLKPRLKTKAILFRPRNKKMYIALGLKIGGEEIEIVSSLKILGVYFSETLSWDLQVDHVSKNIAKAIGVLCRTRDILPIRVKYMLYNSLLACHLQYCNLVWASTTLVNIQKLLRLQKRAIRIVAGESYLAHTAPLFEKFKIMKFDKLYDYNIVRLYRHYQKGKIYKRHPFYADTNKPNISLSTRFTMGRNTSSNKSWHAVCKVFHAKNFKLFLG